MKHRAFVFVVVAGFALAVPGCKGADQVLAGVNARVDVVNVAASSVVDVDIAGVAGGPLEQRASARGRLSFALTLDSGEHQGTVRVLRHGDDARCGAFTLHVPVSSGGHGDDTAVVDADTLARCDGGGEGEGEGGHGEEGEGEGGHGEGEGEGHEGEGQGGEGEGQGGEGEGQGGEGEGQGGEGEGSEGEGEGDSGDLSVFILAPHDDDRCFAHGEQIQFSCAAVHELNPDAQIPNAEYSWTITDLGFVLFGSNVATVVPDGLRDVTCTVSDGGDTASDTRHIRVAEDCSIPP